MKIAIAQINPVIGAFDANFTNIIAKAQTARDLGCDLVVFSEMVITGYPPRDLLEKKDFIDANLACLDRLINTIRGIGVICGCVETNPGEQAASLFNTAVLFEDGKILHKAVKRLLPTYDVFDERRYFEPGTECKAFSYKDRRLGLTVCEDVWNGKEIFNRRLYALDPVQSLIEDGADILINISASPFWNGKDAARKRVMETLARQYGVPLVFANQTGGNDSVLFDGVSTAMDPAGRILARAADFEEDLVIFDTDPAQNTPDQIHPISASEPESILKALTMGTRDYMAKCGFQKALVGLSGGIDSALVACIAARAVGPENVLTVFMPSAYTAGDNFEDTAQLAKNLGVQLRTIPIGDIFTSFLSELCPAFDHDAPAVAEQNIQARIRGTILMGLSNADGYLLLSTGNKSEMAVGYCTLYGDMNGGLSVIADVPKTMVYAVAEHVNQEKEIIPRRILDKAPSAELKPGQTDQDDLPAYDVLDAILKAYVEEGKSVDQVVDMGFDRAVVQDVVMRIIKNEYKRQQAAPGLKVTSKAFGYGRRFPIAQHYR